MLKYKLGGYFALKKKKKKKKRCSFSISSWVNLSMFDMKLNKFVNNAVLSNFVFWSIDFCISTLGLLGKVAGLCHNDRNWQLSEHTE